MPKRIQRKRTKGWRMPPNAVYVGRPTKWGNPFPVGTIDLQESLRLYRQHVHHHRSKGRLDIDELRGKDLACWCPLDQPCHADVLLDLANR